MKKNKKKWTDNEKGVLAWVQEVLKKDKGMKRLLRTRGKSSGK